MSIEAGDLAPEAARILRAVPGVTVAVDAGRGGDACVAYGGAERSVVIEQRSRVNAGAAYQLVHEVLPQAQHPLLLVAGSVTGDARELLAQHGVGVIDASGYAHVQMPGLLLRVEGGGQPAARMPARLRGKAGVVAQALLLEPARDWKVKDLVERSGVSAGLAHRVLARLEDERIIDARGAGPARTRVVASPGALLELWAEEDQAQPRSSSRGHVLAPSVAGVVDRVTSGLAAAEIPYAVTGAAAAHRHAPFVTALPVVEVWVPERVAVEQVLDAAGAAPVDSGHNVAFLSTASDTGLAFAREDEGVVLANPFRIYGDLRRDPRRGAEQAQRLREEVLGV